tara:strand:- start:400 stop:642 length:243 start_codon:yes stop_codon:yes gene_type:complete
VVFYVAGVFVDPEGVAGVVDVTDTVFECLQEEGGDAVDVREVAFVLICVCAENTEDHAEYADPHEHENGKVKAINKSNCY